MQPGAKSPFRGNLALSSLKYILENQRFRFIITSGRSNGCKSQNALTPFNVKSDFGCGIY